MKDVIDLVDVKLILDQAVESRSFLGDRSCGAGLLVVEDVGDKHAKPSR